ncbi:OmpA family protein, partial [Mycetocola reblochoni]
MHRRLPLALALVTTLALTSCTTGEPAPVDSGSAVPGDGASSGSGAELFVEGHLTAGDEDTAARIGPLVNRGDHAVLVLELVHPDGTAGDGFERRKHWMAHPFRGVYRFPLLDLDAGTVEEPVRLGDDQDSDSEATAEIPASSGSPSAAYSVYGVQDRESVDVLVPSVGLVEDVPVVDESALPDGDDVRSVAAIDAAEEQIGLPGQEIVTRTAQLESFALSDDSAQDIEVTPDRVDINLNSDVLFDSAADTLSDGAESELRRVAAQLEAIDGGEVTIVGHTDDVDTDEYNQALSERRAEAVHTRLAELSDLDGLSVSVEGRGETEPRVSGTTAEDRAANRRVEVLVVPDEPSAPVVIEGGEGELPEPEGPVGSAGEGVTAVNDDGEELHIDLEELRTRGRYLVGDVAVRNVGEDTNSLVMNSLRAMTLSTPRGESEPNQMNMPSGLTLLEGGQRFFPVDYSIDGAPYTPVVPDQAVTLEPGESVRLAVVWPRMASTSAVLDVSDYKGTLKGGRAHYFL